MSYQIIIPKPVQKQLDSLPKTQRDRAIMAVRSLTNEPRPTGVKKLKGYAEDIMQEIVEEAEANRQLDLNRMDSP